MSRDGGWVAAVVALTFGFGALAGPAVRAPARFIDPRAAKLNGSPAGCALAADFDRNNGSWTVRDPSPKKPGTCTFDVGVGPSRLLLFWQSSGNSAYEETTYGGPGSYRIETSADSKDGKNGTWKVAVAVEDNTVMNRVHAVDFAGQRWLRFVLTGKSKQTYEHGVQLDALQLYDISQGGDDTWLFLGDSITAEVWPGGRVTPSFATRIRARAPAYTPVVLTAGSGFFKVGSLLEVLPQRLELNADVMTWAICIGSNDNPNDPISFRRDLELLVKALQAAGKTVVLARIPWQAQSDVKWLNAEIDTVTQKYKLPRGPDLHSYFKAHPDQLRDGLHPTKEGAVATHQLWAEAMLLHLYPAEAR